MSRSGEWLHAEWKGKKRKEKSMVVTPLAMGLLEHRDFLLCCRVKSTLLQCISDSLRMDMVGDDRINKLGGLNCIIKPPRFNLMNNGLLVTSRQLGRMTSRIVLLVSIPLFADSTHSTLP